MIKPSTQDNYIRTALRLPRDLHQRVQEDAERNGRTMNAEIIARLASDYAGVTLPDIARQNEKTHSMIQQIIDAISIRR
jgi:hypothetical protein